MTATVLPFRPPQHRQRQDRKAMAECAGGAAAYRARAAGLDAHTAERVRDCARTAVLTRDISAARACAQAARIVQQLRRTTETRPCAPETQ